MISVLLSPADANRDLAIHLERLGARAITWPEVSISEPENYSALDEAIENLFGYDWLILKNASAADFFLRRFHELHHEINELDPLRVCAIGEATAESLSESHIHLDLPIDRFCLDAVFGAIESFVGGCDSLRGLNFLLPSAGFAHDHFEQKLVDAGARVDMVTAYRTTSNKQRLAQMNAMLAGGGIDCIAFTSPTQLEEFAQLSDTDELSGPRSGVVVACADDETKDTAPCFGLPDAISAKEFTVAAFARLIIASANTI
jgi:uroporphyrinogen-III synthase